MSTKNNGAKSNNAGKSKWVACDCITTIEKKALEKFQKEKTEGGHRKFDKIDKVQVVDQALLFSGGVRPYSNVEITGVKKNKRGEEKKVVQKTTFLHSFCFACGKPLTDPDKKDSEE